MKNTTFPALILFCYSLALSPGISQAQVQGDSLSLQVEPDSIMVGAFYNGSELEITGHFFHCDDIVLLLEGNETEMELNRKGRVFVLWMNVAKIKVANSPQIYFLLTSGTNSKIWPREELKQLNLGYESLKEKVKFSSDKPLTGREFEEFIKLKERKGMYKLDYGGIKTVNAEGGLAKFSATIHLPPSIPPGRYELKLYGFNGNELKGETYADLNIEKTGLPKFMSEMAFQHPAQYGVVAIIVAMVAGLLMGIIFSRGRG